MAPLLESGGGGGMDPPELLEAMLNEGRFPETFAKFGGGGIPELLLGIAPVIPDEGSVDARFGGGGTCGSLEATAPELLKGGAPGEVMPRDCEVAPSLPKLGGAGGEKWLL